MDHCAPDPIQRRRFGLGFHRQVVSHIEASDICHADVAITAIERHAGGVDGKTDHSSLLHARLGFVWFTIKQSDDIGQQSDRQPGSYQER